MVRGIMSYDENIFEEYFLADDLLLLHERLLFYNLFHPNRAGSYMILCKDAIGWYNEFQEGL